MMRFFVIHTLVYFMSLWTIYEPFKTCNAKACYFSPHRLCKPCLNVCK